ncbi:MAG: hypothetical protein KDK55_04575 [Chlamydiia bacterium]|nr:hypothetical protein [Chlamydiia bacterium]
MRLFLLTLRGFLILSSVLCANEVALIAVTDKPLCQALNSSSCFGIEKLPRFGWSFSDSEEVKSKTQVMMAGHQGGYLGYPRDYYAPLNSTERSDIHYIITSLANRSLASILFHKSELEAAGDRIDHVHPLRFLECVFTTEEYKVGIRNIRGRGWIWGDFIGGIKSSLGVEADIDNLTHEMIYDFATTVQIKPGLILPEIQNRNWDKFVDLLIMHIPRKGDGNRYDD